MKTKRHRILLSALVLLVALFPSSVRAEANLLTNASFDASASGVLPDGWTAHVWNTDAGVTDLSVEPIAEGSSDRVLTIANHSPNDARVGQTVSVQPDKTYRFSAQVLAAVPDGGTVGAILSVVGDMGQSIPVYETDGQWVGTEVYIVTGPSVTSVEVALGVGGYGSSSAGTARFNDAVLEEVSSVPAGAAVIRLGTSTGGDDATPSGDAQNQPSGSSVSQTGLDRAVSIVSTFLALAGVLSYVYFLVAIWLAKPKDPEDADPNAAL